MKATELAPPAPAPEHRTAAVLPHTRTHDSIVALDMFSGCGGSSQGLEAAGIDVWYAANHWQYAVEVHEANHPRAEHFIADLVDETATDYYHPEALPRADVLWASPSCVNHSKANATRAYRSNTAVSEVHDELFEEQVTTSERSRATAVCVLQYARKHRPKVVVVENVVEFCFVEETVVLTKRGAIPISEVVVGDEVVTHNARWRPVTAVRTLVKPTVRLLGAGNSIIETTAGHQFYARAQHSAADEAPSWVQAAELPGHLWATPRVFPRFDCIIPDSLAYVADRGAFMASVGIWLSNPVLTTTVQASKDRLEETDPSLTITAVEFALAICQHPPLARWLEEQFGSDPAQRRLPAWVFADPNRDQLLEGLASLDPPSRPGVVSVDIASRSLAVGARMVAESLGYVSSISQVVSNANPVELPVFRVTWAARAPAMAAGALEESHRWSPVIAATPTGSERTVIDITVAEDHSFIADGQVVHNCQWGSRVGTSRKGDGTTFQWWLAELAKLGYNTRVLFLNSMFFDVPQSRDRMYVVCWNKKLRAPNLEFTPPAHCVKCDSIVQAVQTWKKRTAAWPMAEWGKYNDQYVFSCPSCQTRVEPLATPAAAAIDWSDLGTRIGDRDRVLAPATIARIQRGVTKFFNGGKDVPALVVPAEVVQDARATQQLPTQSAQQPPTALSPIATQLATRPTGKAQASMSFVDSCVGAARHVDEVLPTQAGTETMGLVTSCDTVVVPLLHTARGYHDGRDAAIEPITAPMSAVSAGGNHHFLLSALFAKQNGGPADTAWHQVAQDSLNTMTGSDTTCLLNRPKEPSSVTVDDCLYRMLKPPEIKIAMGMPAEFKLFGTARNQVRALGNAVTPPVTTWIMQRVLASLKR